MVTPPLECRHSQQASAAATFDALLHSDRVSQGTRAVLLQRGQADDPGYQPKALDAAQFAILRAMLDRVVPQDSAFPIDLAARIDAALADGTGDGWRHATLPPDAEAYRRGLATLDASAQAHYGCSFGEVAGEQRDTLLQRLDPGALSAAQMARWFEDLRSDAVRFYVAHPTTLARIGYDGFANGGDGLPKTGFVKLGAGEHDAWEQLL